MEKFNQLCVWPGTSLDGNTPQDLVDFFKDELNARIQFEQTVLTNPDLDENGNIVSI
jgi:hypothetical protein